MPANVIQANYETLDQVARLFNQNATIVEKTLWHMIDKLEALASDGWWGEGADAFYAEMEDEVLPQVRRLKAALENSAEYTFRISELLQDAEDEASRRFTNEAIITAQGGLTEADYGGGGSGNYVVEYDYDPTTRPDGMIFYKYHQVRPYGGIDIQFDALNDYVEEGNTLPTHSFVNYYGMTNDGNANISSNSHPEAYMQNEDGSLILDESGNPIPKPGVTVDDLDTVNFTVNNDGNICGPMTLASIANAMLGLSGDDRIHPGQALSDLVGIWDSSGETVNIFREGDRALLGTAPRDPSDTTFIRDMTGLGNSYGLDYSLTTIHGMTPDQAQTFFETELGEGRVPMVLINIDSEGIVAAEPNIGDLTNHYVAVTSVQTAGDGQDWVQIYNPYNNQMEYYHMEDFQAAFVNGPNTAISFTNPNYQVPENALPINVANWEPVDDSVGNRRGDAQ